MPYQLLAADISEDVSQAYQYNAWNLSYEDVVDSQEHPIHVSYQYMDLCKTDYGFEQDFCELDARMYFRIMRYFADKTIRELVDAGARGVCVDNEGHWVRLRRHEALHKPLKEQLSKISRNIVNGTPMIFHFGLYTAEDGNACRETGVRSPRIYFMLGVYGLIYPLLFDPYHELTK